MNRRPFLKKSALALLSTGFLDDSVSNMLNLIMKEEPIFFKISLAQWSLHRTIRAGKLRTLDFPAFAMEKFDIDAVEYVNQFFIDKAKNKRFLKELQKRSEESGVENVLIMIDAEGSIGDLNNKKRKKAVENHYKWVEAAKFLGCQAIRVNAAGEGGRKEVQLAAIEGLHSLSEFANGYDINVIVENHGGYSSEGDWLAEVIKKVDLTNCGTLPDFGNFYEYDRYQGVADLMPYAKGVSAKSHEFDDLGNETSTDYLRMLSIVKNAGYKGYIGIEYEGADNDEIKGIERTKRLLLSTGKNLK